MKRVLSISTFFLVFFLATDIASARVFFGFGFFPPAVIGPPVIVAPLRPTTRILTAIMDRDIMVIGCGCRATGIIYRLITVGRKSGIRDIGSIVLKKRGSPCWILKPGSEASGRSPFGY